MIAVHCGNVFIVNTLKFNNSFNIFLGAGRYSANRVKDYKLLSKKACKKAMTILEGGGTALEAVKAAIIILENDPLTNAGFGSNLTLDGLVECDASIMNGENLLYGACGAVRRVKNPVSLACDIYEKQLNTLPFGLVPPQLLVGSGAYKHAKNSGLKTVKGMKLISKKALKQHLKYKNILESNQNEEQTAVADSLIEINIDHCNRNDTVGAVCIDNRGHVAAGCSSGGLILKRPGRVGQAALYGSGVWADSMNTTESSSVAVCTTGCGEQIVQTHLAKTIAEDLAKGKTCPTVDLHRCLNEKFMKSKYLHYSKVAKLCGALVLKVDKSKKIVSLLWGHSTSHLAVGYMKLGENRAYSQISTLPDDAREGDSVNIGGTEFYLTNFETH